MKETFYIKRNDLQPYYRFQVSDTDGNPVDLSGATVKTTMKNVRTGTVVTSGQAAVVTSAAGGLGEYRWVSSDTALPGKYNIEFEVSPLAGGKFTVPDSPDETAEVIILDSLDDQ